MDNRISIPSRLITKTEYFDSSTPAVKVAPALTRHEAVIINKGGAYYGIVDSRAMYRAERGLVLDKNEQIAKYAVQAPRITGSTPIDDVVYYFYNSRRKALPFLYGDKVGGVLERKTFLKMLLSLKVLESMRVREVMSTPVLSIDASASVSEAAAAMRQHNVKRLAVLANGRLAGLVTNHDISRKFAVTGERMPLLAKRYTPSNITVSSVMEPNVVSISQDAGVSDAMRQFVERNISSLIVTKKGAPIGIITVFDVLEGIVARRRIQERRVYISGLDAYTYQYQDELREALNNFIAETERLHGMSIDYLTLRVKGIKLKSYEMYVRLYLGRKGALSIHVNDYRFEAAFRELLKKLRAQVVKEKGYLMTMKKVNLLREAET